MLVLNPRFALLATFCSLAAITFSPCWSVRAAAIQSRFFDHDHCHNVTSDQPSAQYVLPLPLQSKTEQFKVRTHEWLYFNPVALFADIAFARLKRDDNTLEDMCRIRKNCDRRDPTSAQMARRSVLIPNSHGSEYVVSHSRQPVHQRRRRSKVGIKEVPLSRRAQDAMVGNVALMSPVYGSDTGEQIATLFAAPNGTGAWTLYASDSELNQTQFRLVDVPASMDSTSGLDTVMLQMDAPGETPTCVTYNSSPSQDESDTQDSNYMIMKPCADRATPETDYMSQIFLRNITSNILQPTWKFGGDGGNTAAASSPLNQNSTSSSNTTSTSSAVQAAATVLANRQNTPSNSTKQNSTVTMVFTPVKAMIGVEENSTTTTITMTTTKTVTVFNMEPTSARVASSSLNTSSQASATSSALDVQLVGAPMPSSNATGTTAMGPNSVSTSSSTSTGSIDAAAIASRIAASASASSASAAAASATGSSTTTSTSSTQTVERRLVATDTVVSTEPYTWIFKEREMEDIM